MKTLLFVYGTLLKGFVNYHHFLAGKEPLYAAATINGDMVSLGAFPGVVNVGTSRNTVHGEVYAVDDTELARIDRLEGYHGDDHRTSNLYNRVPCTISVGGISMPDERVYTYELYTYEFGRSERQFFRIISGSWRQYTNRTE